MEGEISAGGVAEDSWTLEENINSTSADQKIALEVVTGTVARLPDGSRVETITVNRITDISSLPPLPDNRAIVGAVNLGPDGAIFTIPLIITMSYDPEQLPPGAIETELYIAYWDGSE